MLGVDIVANGEIVCILWCKACNARPLVCHEIRTVTHTQDLVSQYSKIVVKHSIMSTIISSPAFRRLAVLPFMVRIISCVCPLLCNSSVHWCFIDLGVQCYVF